MHPFYKKKISRWFSALAWQSPPGPWSPSSAQTWWRGGGREPAVAGLLEFLPPENLEVDFEDQVLQQRGISPSLPQLKVCREAARGQIEALFTIRGKGLLLVTIRGKTFVWVVN